MSISANDLADGVVLNGSQFSEPMRVIGNPTVGDGFVFVNLVGTRSKTFRGGVTLTKADLRSIEIERPEAQFGAKPRLVKLALEALRISLAQEYDPFFGLSISRVDPLPHQLDAVYNHLLKSARCRFLLADDAGAGKTIMAGLLLKELKLRGLVERVLIICPANLAFQWQREMADRFQESFHILRGADLRVQYGVNMWNEKAQIITSMDLAKREEILPSVRQAMIGDDGIGHRGRSPSHVGAGFGAQKRAVSARRTSPGEDLPLSCCLTATPHKGDPVNFCLFLQLLDQEAYADVKSIHDAMERREAACYLRRTKEVMLNFPKPQADGTWKAVKLFTKRIPQTVAFSLEGDEMDLYKAVTHYVQRQSARAAEVRRRAPRPRRGFHHGDVSAPDGQFHVFAETVAPSPSKGAQATFGNGQPTWRNSDAGRSHRRRMGGNGRRRTREQRSTNWNGPRWPGANRTWNRNSKKSPTS